MRCRYTSIGMQALLMIVLVPSTVVADEAADIKACDAGNMAKCEELVVRYGEGATKNPVKWIAYAEKACNLNSGRACNNLGVAWSKAENGASRVDHAKALTYYKKACDLAHGLGCFNFANIYRLGEGVALDLKLAFENFKKSCDLVEAKGCTELAIMHYEGKAVPKNVPVAKTLLEKACKLGSAAACKNVELLKDAK